MKAPPAQQELLYVCFGNGVRFFHRRRFHVSFLFHDDCLRLVGGDQWLKPRARFFGSLLMRKFSRNFSFRHDQNTIGHCQYFLQF